MFSLEHTAKTVCSGGALYMIIRWRLHLIMILCSIRETKQEGDTYELLK